MLNLSGVITNPDFVQTFKVYRSEGSFVSGRWVETPQSPPYFEMPGIVYPSSAREIEQLPQGDRITGMMTFLSTEPLYTTRQEDDGEMGLSDKIEWRGELYRLIQMLPWQDYGYYMAVGSRMKGT